MTKRLPRVPILEILESVSKTEVRCCVAAIVPLALLGRGFPTDSKIRKRPSFPSFLCVYSESHLSTEREKLWIVSAALFVPFFLLLFLIVILSLDLLFYYAGMI